jgi:hypothetical protein
LKGYNEDFGNIVDKLFKHLRSIKADKSVITENFNMIDDVLRTHNGSIEELLKMVDSVNQDVPGYNKDWHKVASQLELVF